VYLAFVEEACAAKKYLNSGVHRQHLIKCCKDWGDEAVLADLDKLVALRLGLEDNRLYALLKATQAWLAAPTALPKASVRKLYADVESERKKGRSRLMGTPGASQQLRRWARSGERASTAGRLHFRWPSVSRLIRDLHE
jgi:hypothetical protein